MSGSVRLKAVVSSTVSDSHTWNLIFLQLMLEEHGYAVANLGACVPDRLLVTRCEAEAPGLIVISTVNGHGYYDGIGAVRALRAVPELRGTPIVIGGKLGIGPSQSGGAAGLLAAGFDAVFGDDTAALGPFRAFIAAPRRVAAL
jgi:methylaspartate mutase sigma subunit